jgi:hypothetical protein
MGTDGVTTHQAGAATREDEIRRAVSRLASRRGRRLVADPAAEAAVTQADLPLLARLLGEELRKRKRRARVERATNALMIAAGVCCTAGTIWGMQHLPDLTIALTAGLLLVGLLGMVPSTAYNLGAFNKRAEAVAEFLAHTGSVDAVRPLLLAWNTGTLDGSTLRIVRDALSQLLPRVQSAEMLELDAESLDRLVRATRFTAYPRNQRIYDPPFAVESLRVLGLVGTRQSLKDLAVLEQREPRVPGQQEIREAARETCARIRERLERESVGASLLRPIDPGAESSLLRPAGAAMEAGAEQLVRPAASPEGSA